MQSFQNSSQSTFQAAGSRRPGLETTSVLTGAEEMAGSACLCLCAGSNTPKASVPQHSAACLCACGGLD